ncbi:F-box only protein 33-like [Littorina saxatilis]|uniref:F-box domain-containing protein n=1 Tax=Littorina saxatilis TaxID=31220 RepID=A0AAN9C3B7_9CAEN
MADGFDWAALPDVPIVRILTHLTHEDKLAASATCKRWRACLFRSEFWCNVSIQFNCWERKRSKFLAKNCGRFVRAAVVKFNSRIFNEAAQCLDVLEYVSRNRNLETFSLQPSSCHLNLPEFDERPLTDADNRSIKRCMYLIKKLVLTARCLRHFSLGCMEVLQEATPDLLPALTQRHALSLQTLHLASVKEDWHYNILEISPEALTPFRSLQALSLDYDNLSTSLLLSLAEPGCCQLRELSLLVHGVRPGLVHVENQAWWQARQTLTQLEVTLVMLHTYEGVAALTSILQPQMPLVRLRQYFCSQVNVAAITFIGNHLSEEFRELEIVEEMENRQPQPYHSSCAEDPFVMLAWRCHSLHSLRLIGIELAAMDIVAIARLRGPRLWRLEVSLSCLVHWVSDDDLDFDGVSCSVPLSHLSEEEKYDFYSQVSESLGHEWYPLWDRQLPPAVLYSDQDAERAYMAVLLKDQNPCQDLNNNSCKPFIL